MKIGLICLLLFCEGSRDEVLHFRKLLQASFTQENAAVEFYTIFKDRDPTSSLYQGYKALSMIMLCNYGSNPLAKYKRFTEGRKLLEKALLADSANTELHFLRHTVQCFAPYLLGYHEDLAEDKVILLNYIQAASCADPNLKQMIAAFLLQADECSENEKTQILKAQTSHFEL